MMITRSSSMDKEKQRAKEIDEMRNIIMNLSVSNLKIILGYANCKKSGLKSELVPRTLALLHTVDKEIFEKIRKLCTQQHNLGSSNYTLSELSTLKISQRVTRSNNNTMYQQIPDSNRAQMHTNGVVVPYSNLSGFPVHPDVRLKKLAFFDVLASLLKPSTLVPNNQTQRVQEGTFLFHLTPQQATDIASNRDMRNGSKIEHTVQVQLRFCLLETSCEQEDYFPPNVVVKVNNKICNLPNIIPTNKPGVEPKRLPRPVNITPHVKLSPTVPNHISVSWCTELNRGYVISAYLVRKLTSTQLLHRLKTKGVKPADFTRGLIKEKLNEDADSEIATTMLRVSLICPLGKMRMTTPCRSSTCSHLQCFDASLYLQMNERKPTWNCPVCDRPGLYETLVVDGYFQEVLISSNLTSDDHEIQLHKDGSWSTHVMRNDTQILDTPNKSIQKVEVISDDLEVITTDPPKSSIKQSSSSNEPSSTTNEVVVDLTLSDSDEDDLPLKRKLPPAKINQISSKPKPNGSDNMNSSIITLDSPSPPSTPNPPSLHFLPTSSTNNVSSTTMNNNCLVINVNPVTGSPASNYHINPMALNRFDTSIDTNIQNQQQNWNVVHPFRETQDQNR